MQQTPHLMNITTEQIQKYLDENRQLIMAILENQNQGKFAESAPFQEQLQQNLMYLAKIADAQPPPPPTASSQMSPQSAAQQEQYAQSAQAAMARQHPVMLAPRLPFQSNDPQQQQHPMYQPQLNQPLMGLRTPTPSGSYQSVQTGVGNNFMNIQGNSQDSQEDGGDEGLRNSAYGRNSRDTESMRLN